MACPRSRGHDPHRPPLWQPALIALLLGFLLLAPGCSAPTATTELIAVGRQGLASAKEAETLAYTRFQTQHAAQVSSLDAAFDADVKLVAAGQVVGADEKPVELTSDWVISARKGYAVARDALAEQLRKETAAHAALLDNLAAADEALELANELTVLQWNVSERFKQAFLKLQGSTSND